MHIEWERIIKDNDRKKKKNKALYLYDSELSNFQGVKKSALISK